MDKPIENLGYKLICPECQSDNLEHIIKYNNDYFLCKRCGVKTKFKNMTFEQCFAEDKIEKYEEVYKND